MALLRRLLSPAAALLAATTVAAPFIAAQPAFAEASLMVTPTRIVFDGPKRTAVLTLLNTGNESGTYRLFLVRYRMTDQGTLEEVKSPRPDEKFADEMIRFTPKQVVLAPQMSQQVRLQFRKPANLAAGEYRSHLLFRALPTIPAAGSPDDKNRGIAIRLVPALGVSIPLIIREGETKAQARLSDLALQPAAKVAGEPGGQGPRLTFKLNRTGNRSLYGDLVATFRPKGGGEVPVGRINGIAIYTPNAARQATLPLTPPAGKALQGGALRLVYRASESEGAQTLAEAEIALP